MRRGRIKTWDVEDRSETHRTVFQKLVGPFLGKYFFTVPTSFEEEFEFLRLVLTSDGVVVAVVIGSVE